MNQGVSGRGFDPLGLIAERAWWPNLAGAPGDALGRLWRHAVAVSQAARRLARDAGDAEHERVARAGLLHGLGRWAVAAIDPQWLADWLGEPVGPRRLEMERRTLGTEATSLGRVLAERWGCDPLVVDAAWLHADGDRTLNGCASDPKRLALIQEAYALAERTPWALDTQEPREPHAADPRLRLLIAEVQVRCGSAFVEPDATPHEERLARSNARLRRQLGKLQAIQQSHARFLDALERSEPTESPETWAERAGLCWCGEPGVTAARVAWTGPGSSAMAEPTGPPTGEASTRDERPAALIVPLAEGGRPCAEIHLWTSSDPASSGAAIAALSRPWQAWAALVAERARLAGRLDEVTRAHRDHVANEEPRLRHAKLDALAEFAAGAGHELNNPLAVIVGRAQLLLVRETDPAAIRSLRAILTQAQRAHRILRDLMYVARTPEPRPRYCQFEEIVRNCLRDLREGTEERGVRLLAEVGGPETKVWADPEALRHLTEILLRNALEATPRGGAVQLTTSTTGAADALTWTVQDNGRGIGAVEGTHLFDPFFCGRQAGRGLGLGLPRADRIVSQAGGSIRWNSTPGHGTTFHVHLPLAEPPRPPQAPAELASSASTNPP
jgi:signal transduction histidine kinase